MADIANRDLKRKVDGGQHLGEEDPPSCHARDEQDSTSSL